MSKLSRKSFEAISLTMKAIKNIPRTEWLIRVIPPSIAETVATHTYEAAIYSLILSIELRRAGVKVNEYSNGSHPITRLS